MPNYLISLDSIYLYMKGMQYHNGGIRYHSRDMRYHVESIY